MQLTVLEETTLSSDLSQGYALKRLAGTLCLAHHVFLNISIDCNETGTKKSD